MRARHLLVHAMFEKGPYEKYIRKHIFFVRHLLVHAVFEKEPYEKYMLFRKFIRLTKNMFFEKVYMFLKKVYMFFEKVCMFLKKYICFLKKYVCFLKKYIFFEKAYIFFVRLLLVHRTTAVGILFNRRILYFIFLNADSESPPQNVGLKYFPDKLYIIVKKLPCSGHVTWPKKEVSQIYCYGSGLSKG